jgi:tRNA dimethylallyltransferase
MRLLIFAPGMSQPKTILYIAGPTASGKSALAVELALRLNTAVLSADSRQFFKGMSIGTGQITEAEQKGIPHYFLNFLTPDANYSAGQFEQDGLNFIQKWFLSNDILIVTGGSGLYCRALLYGFNPMPETDSNLRAQLDLEFQEKGFASLQQELAFKDPETWSNIDQQNPRRVIRALELIRQTGGPIGLLKSVSPLPRPFRILTLGVAWERAQLYERINQRVLQMIDHGWEAEARSLLNQGYSPDLSALKAVGYPELFDLISGKLPREEVIAQIQQHTRNYAKRQMTWLRKEPGIQWISGDNPDEFLIKAEAYLRNE